MNCQISNYIILITSKLNIMNFQKVLISGVIIGVVSFFLGWLIWGILLADFAKIEGMSSISRPETEMVMWAMAVSNLVWGILLAYIFELGNVNTMQAGLMTGAIIGLLYALSLDFGFYAMTTLFTTNDIVKDVIINTVYAGILGAILGWWNGRK